MARWPINVQPTIVMAAIAIGLDHVLIGIDGGFDDGSFFIDSTWPCWAIDLSKAFDSSAERLLK
jgi:hypothetical protein